MMPPFLSDGLKIFPFAASNAGALPAELEDDPEAEADDEAER